MYYCFNVYTLCYCGLFCRFFFPNYFWSKMLFVGTVTISVFSWNSNWTMNLALVLIFLTRKSIYLKLFLELHNDVLIMFPNYFWSKLLFVGTVTILVFYWNCNRTMNYSLGTYFLTRKNIYLKLFLELHNDVLIMFPNYFWSKMLFVGTVSILVFSWNCNQTMNLVLIFWLEKTCIRNCS